jgi:competence protein ComGC
MSVLPVSACNVYVSMDWAIIRVIIQTIIWMIIQTIIQTIKNSRDLTIILMIILIKTVYFLLLEVPNTLIKSQSKAGSKSEHIYVRSQRRYLQTVYYCSHNVLHHRLNQETSSKEELLHCTSTESIHVHLHLEGFSVE